MVERALDDRSAECARVLRAAGARFAFVHGSRANGTGRPDSDLDVAAWWTDTAPDAWEVSLPANVDLLILNSAPLALTGRVALDGVLLFDDDPPERVAWQATTRKLYLDELPAQQQVDRDFLEACRRG